MANAVALRTPSYVATVVAIATDPTLDETAAALETLRTRSSVRTILVTLGTDPQPPVERRGDATTIHGLLPKYVNNAVAALRLSSLPSLAWWRRTESSLLADMAHLVDRLLLDSPDPEADWSEAIRLRQSTSFSDMRWTRLTRWRNMMAQFFELPDIRAAARSYTRLSIAAEDAFAARLFGGWLRARLPAGDALDVSITRSAPAGQSPLTSVVLSGGDAQLRLQALPSGTCLEAASSRGSAWEILRVVPVGDLSPASLLLAEMRARARDTAFEEALERMRRS